MDGGAIIEGSCPDGGGSPSSGIVSIGKDELLIVLGLGSNIRFMLDVTPRGTVQRSFPSHSELVLNASGTASYKTSLNGK